MSTSSQPIHTAVIGAGIAGASCAQALAQAGHRVQVFDKARGAGGRLATRRLTWVDPEGRPQLTRLDHGAPGFNAQSAGFRAFVERGVQAGLLAVWQPRRATEPPSSEGRPPRPSELAGMATVADDACYLPVPDMPALCRHLVQGLATHWDSPVTQLHRLALGWKLTVGEQRLPDTFDQVVLALPPAQAATLLAPHQRDWARQAAITPMQPCWTVMGISASAAPGLLAGGAPDWDLAVPSTGPLARVMRQHTRPGRERQPGQAHWVLQARASWSRQHLEQPADWVQLQLQAALDELLGTPLRWLHSVAHRWRYAQTQNTTPTPGQRGHAACWWDASRGLGVCGDFLGGGGVEGAWQSAQAMAAAVQAPAAAGAALSNPGAAVASAPTPSPAPAPPSRAKASPASSATAADASPQAESDRAWLP